MRLFRLFAGVWLLLACSRLIASESADSKPPPETPAKRSPWLAVPIVSSNPKLGTTGGFLAAYLHKFDADSRVSLFGLTAQYTTTHSLVASAFARASFGADHHRVIGILAFGDIKNDYDDYLGTGQPLKTNETSSRSARVTFTGSRATGSSEGRRQLPTTRCSATRRPTT